MEGVFLHNLNSKVKSIEKVLLVFLLTCMFILGMMQIISRFIIKSPISWSEVMLTYMFIWSSFIGASVAVDEKSHFAVDIFVKRLPDGFQHTIEIFVNFLILVFAAFVVYKGMYLVLSNRDQLMSAMPFSMSWPYLALPVSSVFIIVHSSNHIYDLCTGRE